MLVALFCMNLFLLFVGLLLNLVSEIWKDESIMGHRIMQKQGGRTEVTHNTRPRGRSKDLNLDCAADYRTKGEATTYLRNPAVIPESRGAPEDAEESEPASPSVSTAKEQPPAVPALAISRRARSSEPINLARFRTPRYWLLKSIQCVFHAQPLFICSSSTALNQGGNSSLTNIYRLSNHNRSHRQGQ